MTPDNYCGRKAARLVEFSAKDLRRRTWEYSGGVRERDRGARTLSWGKLLRLDSNQ